MSSKLCNTINNVAFVSAGYFDHNALLYAATGFVFGIITGITIGGLM